MRPTTMTERAGVRVAAPRSTSSTDQADQRHRRALQAGEVPSQRAAAERREPELPGPPAFREHAEPQPDATRMPRPRRGGAAYQRPPLSLLKRPPAEQSRRRAHAGRAARAGAAAGERARRLRRQGRGQERSPRPGRHALRVRAGARRQVGARDRACRRHRALDGCGVGARRRRARPQRHRHRAAERAAREGQPAPAARVGGVPDLGRRRCPLVLGRDIAGAPVFADLARMPHLLVAGTTGAGKSVGVNAMILSLLYKLSPEQCRFLMIDPEDAGAVGLQRHPASAVPGGDRSGQGGGGAQLGGRRDGAALPAHVLAGGAQHRRLQQPRAPGAEARQPAAARRTRISRPWPTSSSSSTSSPT